MAEIERDNRIRIAYSVPVGLCMRALALWFLPTAQELTDWANSNVPNLFLEPITLEQAQYMLDHLDEVA